jgi:hypothetical protein
MMQKINKTQSWFFEKINTIENPLAKLTKRKRQNTQINNIRDEKGNLTTDVNEIKRNHQKVTLKT